MHVLIVDDEPHVREAVARVLRLAGHTTTVVGDGATALECIADADVLVLDVLMPGLSGLDVCRHLRQCGNRVPILMLTARESVGDRVAGLDAGADDYLVKPFAFEELIARLRALTRRIEPNSRPLVVGDLQMDTSTREVTRGDRAITLTRTEFSLLHLLLSNAPQVLSRDTIYDRVWGYDAELASNSLEVYIAQIRRKTEQGGEPRLIQTIRGVGYVLRES